MAEPETDSDLMDERDEWLDQLSTCKRNYLAVAAERDTLTAQRDTLLAACQRTLRFVTGNDAQEDWGKPFTQQIKDAIAAALPPTEEGPR